MGKFPISDGIAGKAMRSTGLVGTPDGKPAWIFENQTGVLGNNSLTCFSPIIFSTW